MAGIELFYRRRRKQAGSGAIAMAAMPGSGRAAWWMMLAVGWFCSANAAGEPPTPYPDRVVSFSVGPGGGYQQDRLPEIVLGPPRGGGLLEAGRDVVSLGQHGSIVLEFVDNEIFDGPGPDLIVFENAFLERPGTDPERGFFELAKVEVSLDGIEWTGFPFDTGTRKGCAGHRPVLANPERNPIDPTDPKVAGGDPFDLQEIGVRSARFIRITDILGSGGEE